ncbi:histidine phosphatase family protein [Planctomycetota bacterium]|nr:histidine phosphatase family protein [Planctomycetota bacterium]
MRLYVIRHADPDYENNTITKLGHQEAEALSERLDDVQIDKIYSSPMGRAMHTAEYTAKRKGMDIEVLDWTAEVDWRVDQEYNGRRMAAYNIHGHEVREIEPQPSWDDWHAYDLLSDEKIKSEFETIKQGSDRLFEDYGYVRDEKGLYRFEESNDAAVAVFCHGGFGLTWLAHLLNIPLPQFWAGFFLRPTSVTTVLLDERIDGVATPRCIGLADSSHLVMKGLDNARVPGGIVANYE